MTFQETVEYLYSYLPIFQRDGAQAIKPGLNNIIALCQYLGNPHIGQKYVHVAGTNGKGTCSHSLAAVLQKAGYKVGLYTSPHLKTFTERIRVTGQLCDEAWVVDFVQKHNGYIRDLKPSFFEMTVGMALQYFKEQETDIAVIEVGMGGLLDSTNIITPVLSVITNISYDHTAILGKTLPEIAFQKAGIIKAGVPVVVGEHAEETYPVFIEVAKKANAALTMAGDVIELQDISFVMGTTHFNVSGLGELGIAKEERLTFGLGGAYQERNLPTVLASILKLNELGWKIEAAALREGLKHVCELTGFKGRWQILQRNPLLIADTAHNPAGLEYVFGQLKGLMNGSNWLHVILGMAADKDLDTVLTLLPKERVSYYITAPKVPRALSAAVLFEKVKGLGIIHVHLHDSVELAVQAAQAAASEDDVIFVGGSTFVVAEVPNL